MSLDSELAHILQEEEFASNGITSYLQNSRSDTEDSTNLEIARVLSREEEDFASKNLAQRIMRQDEELSSSFQQALKLQDRERASKCGCGPSDINFSTTAFSESINNTTYREKEEDIDEIEYDWETLGAMAPSPASSPTPFSHHHNLDQCFRQEYDTVSLDEQVARLLQEEVEAEEDRLSLQLALKLATEEEERVNKKSHNRGRANNSTRYDRPRLVCPPPPQRPRQNVSLLGRAPNMSAPFHHHPQRNVGINNTHAEADFGYDDLLVMQSLADFSDSDVFLLPPGLQNFQSHPGQSHDFIPIPEGSNFEELLALTDSLGDVSCGLSESQIAKLPTKRWSAESRPANRNDINCSICLSDYMIGDELRMLPCLHDFHRQCVDPWLKDKPNCPTCRADVKV